MKQPSHIVRDQVPDDRYKKFLTYLVEMIDPEEFVQIHPEFTLEEISSYLHRLHLFAAVPGANRWTLYTDGCSKGNPGEAGIGFSLYDHKGTKVCSGYQYIQTATNNQAEYRALLTALKTIQQTYPLQCIGIYSDSELMVKQINGQYRIKDPVLRNLYQSVIELLRQFTSWEITSIRRTANHEADMLANKAVEEKNTALSILN